MAQVWVGVDAGKQTHHAVAVDIAGRVLWSTRVANDQQAIAELISRVGADDEVVWAVDLVGCETGLLRAMLALAGQHPVYIPGRTVKTMAAGFAGEAKTDARDAVVIANTARMRRDFLPVATPTELIAKLALLVAGEVLRHTPAGLPAAPGRPGRFTAACPLMALDAWIGRPAVRRRHRVRRSRLITP